MSNPQTPLRPENCFHVYNHAVGHENLFPADKDYAYFLKKIIQHVVPVSDILSFCLMPNHFHLVIRIKNPDETENFFRLKTGTEKYESQKSKNENYLEQQISKCYSNLFNTYAKYYNFHYNRTGTLFKRTFRRKKIDDLGYLKRLICYVHQNPVVAGFIDKPELWRYSSYAALLSSMPTLIPREEIIGLFEDLENLKFCHARLEEIKID